MNWKRHTLLDISDTGREEILSELAGDSPLLREQLGDILLPEKAGARIPGIIRREETAPRPSSVALGFCGPSAGTEGRLRVGAFVKPEDVLLVTTPYQLLSSSRPIPNRTASTRALAAASDQALSLGLTLGVWGSAAQEIYTGLPYTHNDSDLDLLVAAAPPKVLSRFLEHIKKLETCFAFRIDVEVDLSSGFGINLKELFGQSLTVIGKGLNSVELFQREDILAVLPDEAGI